MLTYTKTRSIRPISLLVSPNEKPLQRVRQLSDPDIVPTRNRALKNHLSVHVLTC